jgi:sugar/nucleoside kinase (ribokinase family)
MNTYLGMSSLLHPDDVDAATVADGQVLYMEGYLFDRPDAKEAFWMAADIAHENGRKVSLTLSDTFCVERHHDDFRRLVAERVDVLFGNEHELCALYDTDDFTLALERVRADLELAVITCGADGSVIATADGVVNVPVEPVAQVLDTTGAGDLYAAGFLFGYTNGRSLPECGRLGSIAAAEVISHMGPRPLVELRALM